MTDRRDDRGAPIVVSAYDLCAALYEHVNRFPRAQRTLLGRLILDEALRLLAALTLANRLQDKRDVLAEASGRLDALRIAVRLAKRLAFLPNRAYARLAETIDEVGRMLGGWLKHEGARGVAMEGRSAGAPAEGQASFEDAKLMGSRFGLKVRDLAADSEPERILACGIPKTRLEHWIEQLERSGCEVHVE